MRNIKIHPIFTNSITNDAICTMRYFRMISWEYIARIRALWNTAFPHTHLMRCCSVIRVSFISKLFTRAQLQLTRMDGVLKKDPIVYCTLFANVTGIRMLISAFCLHEVTTSNDLEGSYNWRIQYPLVVCILIFHNQLYLSDAFVTWNIYIYISIKIQQTHLCKIIKLTQ